MSQKVQFDQIAEIIPGMAFRSTDADLAGAIPVLGASSITSGSVLSDFDELPKISQLPTRSPAIAHDNDMIMIARSVPGKPFRASLVRTDIPLVVTSSVYIIRIKNSDVFPEYLNIFLNSKQFQQQVIQEARGSTIFHISKQALGKIEIPIPEFQKQKAIIELHKNIQRQDQISERKKQIKEEIIQAAFTNLYQ